MRKGLVIGGIALLLVLGCNNGAIEELEKKNSFYESVLKIGQGFQEIFGIFGNAMGEALGFSAVKSDDTRDKVGKHFEKIGEGLKSTKEKLDGLAKEIASTPHADIKGVEDVINSASEVITKLITSMTNLAGVTKGDSSTEIGKNDHNGAAGANDKDVNEVIESVKTIVDVGKKSGVKIYEGSEGVAVNSGANTAAPAVLGVVIVVQLLLQELVIN